MKYAPLMLALLVCSMAFSATAPKYPKNPPVPTPNASPKVTGGLVVDTDEDDELEEDNWENEPNDDAA